MNAYANEPPLLTPKADRRRVAAGEVNPFSWGRAAPPGEPYVHTCSGPDGAAKVDAPPTAVAIPTFEPPLVTSALAPASAAGKAKSVTVSVTDCALGLPGSDAGRSRPTG